MRASTLRPTQRSAAPPRAAPSATIVVPCFNEARRLRPAAFQRFALEHPEVRFIFVDDGSDDDSPALLRQLQTQDPRRFEVITLPRNCGQGEAVRVGICRAFARGDARVGFWDADLAAPLSEIPRLVAALEEAPGFDVVYGSRVQLLGSEIRRRRDRYYLGRLFAGTARLVLDLGVYDTQCGAKLFRRTPQLEAVFATPFQTRWLFDVEILARLQQSSGDRAALRGRVRELPLRRWRDVAGTKLKPGDFLRAPLEVLQIYRDLKR
jgi:glycosyltransferase involved in cell wall biosynthesis